jgi:hypothetical protein
MSGLSVGYEIGRATGRCAQSGEVLAPAAPCVATLCERDGDEGFDRIDFSLAAWESGARPPRLFSYWKSVMPESNRRRQLLADDDVLMDLFRRLESDDRPQRMAFRFVLGLALMRKKLIRCVGRREEHGCERWLMTVRGGAPGDAPIEMVNPHLSDEDAKSIAEQLGDALQAEL